MLGGMRHGPSACGGQASPLVAAARNMGVLLPTLPPSSVFGRSRGHPLDPGKEGSALPALSRVCWACRATRGCRSSSATSKGRRLTSRNKPPGRATKILADSRSSKESAHSGGVQRRGGEGRAIQFLSSVDISDCI